MPNLNNSINLKWALFQSMIGVLLLAIGCMAAAQETFVNPCGSGFFMDAKGNCYPCHDASAPTVLFNETASASCLSCSNREVVNGFCRLTGCHRGQQFRDDKGHCFSCDTLNSALVGADTERRTLCMACLNREVSADGICRLKAPVCKNKNGFISETGDCFLCDYPEKVFVGNKKAAQDMCVMCGNREIGIGGFCQIKQAACRKGQKFQGFKEACYACQEPQPIEIGKNIILQHSCFACGNRFATHAGFCVQKPVPSAHQFVTEKGDVYDCQEPTAVVIGYDKTVQDLCQTCGRVVDRDMCRLNTDVQPNDTLLPADKTFAGLSGRVYPCAVETGIPVGTDVLRRDSCVACGNRFVSASDLCMQKECADASSFMDAVGLCHPCSEPNSIFVGWNESVLNAKCQACQRQILNGLCVLPASE